MAPKILLKDLKGGTKSQWNHRNEEYYKMVIKGLDRMTFEKVNDYIQKGWNSEAAHKQVLWDEEEALEKPEKEEDEMGKCPGCFRSFSNVHRRFKMSSGKCGHILCSSCVEDLYLLQKIKCSRFGCDEELRMSDWAKWQPVGDAPKLSFGFVGTMPMSKIKPRDQTTIDAAKSESKSSDSDAIPPIDDEDGLFVADYEDD
jgi:hypothetical protein